MLDEKPNIEIGEIYPTDSQRGNSVTGFHKKVGANLNEFMMIQTKTIFKSSFNDHFANDINVLRTFNVTFSYNCISCKCFV